MSNVFVLRPGAAGDPAHARSATAPRGLDDRSSRRASEDALVRGAETAALMAAVKRLHETYSHMPRDEHEAVVSQLHQALDEKIRELASVRATLVRMEIDLEMMRIRQARAQ
ncbi:MAG: hypothetical protein JWN93_103 [Hyphomicrobiales bacterium]|jgi:hypothetical protein|nr:hypothetical protein [Hyphomicrobiales bacterium]